MVKVKNILQMTSLLFAMTMLFCYIAWSLGYEGFVIVGDINIPLWAERIISSILLCTNLSLLTGFTLDLYSWKTLYFSIPIVMVCQIVNTFGIAINGPLWTLIMIFSVLIMKKDQKNKVSFAIFGRKYSFGQYTYGFGKIFLGNAITLIYQWIISKISMVDLTHQISIYKGLWMSINSIFIMLLLYVLGGVKHELDVRVELLVFPGAQGNNREGSAALPQDVDGIPVTNFEKWLMRSVIGVVQILQWMFILWVCNLDNLFLDALAMTTSFICHGMIISKRKHLKPVILCTLAATAMFYFCARFTISFQYSQFFPIVIGLILAYTLYHVDRQFEMQEKEKHKKDLEKIAELEKQVDEAWQRLDELS